MKKLIISYRMFFIQVISLLIASVVTTGAQDITTYDQCGADITTESGIIKSPDYPQSAEDKTRYGNNLNCVWKVDLNNKETLYAAKFLDLVTQHRIKPNNETICYDYVNITTESAGTQQYCGFKKPEEIYTGVGPTLTILFVSDEKYGYRGFMLVFKGVRDHDPCKEEPCKNGKCVVMEDKVRYECDCEPGFTGYNCHVDIDECASDPCANGATCEQTDNPGYECFCATGWQGTNCEIVRNPDPCLSNPCKNGGTCRASDDNEEFFCTCVVGYTGITCRNDIDECASNPCQNGGTCEDGVNQYDCTCGRLYYGGHCEKKQKINGCREGPCSENGDCVSLDDEGNYKCECLDGWTGVHCEEDVQECESNPCQNGGICDDTIEFNRFDCTCVGGYTGTFCEIAPPMCTNPGIPYLQEGAKWIEGSTLQFYCVEGYVLQGSENLTCLKNETWSLPMPECVVDNNSTSAAQTGALSPWIGTMIVLSSMLAITLVAFVTWIMLKGPWNFGPSVTRIMSLSQVSIATFDPNKEC
uniref:fibropellin-3-like n=1 Tax=Styela clava TaxID=7725 RepID=UPI00193AD2F8|nr:fibropellin-3-like [Styela clava]